MTAQTRMTPNSWDLDQGQGQFWDLQTSAITADFLGKISCILVSLEIPLLSLAQGDKNATDGQILELSEIYSLHNISSRDSETPQLPGPETGKQTLI